MWFFKITKLMLYNLELKLNSLDSQIHVLIRLMDELTVKNREAWRTGQDCLSHYYEISACTQ